MTRGGFVEDFYERHAALYQHLVATGEPTFASDLNVTFTRSLVLAIASFFEHEVTNIVRLVPKHHAAGSVLIAALVERQVISRRYHQWFDWDNLKPGPFLAMFGEEFKNGVGARLKRETASGQAMSAFLELGQLRNNLVHNNFARFTVPKTPEELMKQFRTAVPVLEFLESVLLPPAVEPEAPGAYPEKAVPPREPGAEP